jgi:hypothetical protein
VDAGSIATLRQQLRDAGLTPGERRRLRALATRRLQRLAV